MGRRLHRIDDDALTGALAAFLSTAPSPLDDPDLFAIWSAAHGADHGDETLLLARLLGDVARAEAEADASAPDATGRTMRLRALRVVRARHADDDAGWAARLSRALLRAPARRVAADAIGRWTPRVRLRTRDAA